MQPTQHEPLAVRYPYVISGVFFTLEAQSEVKIVHSDNARMAWGLYYCCVSLLLGWWAVPWGFRLTPHAAWRSLLGGVEEPLHIGTEGST